MKRLVRVLSIVVACGSLLVIGYVLRARSRPADTVRMVGIQRELMQLLRERAAEREWEERNAGGPLPAPDPSLGWVPLRRAPVEVDVAAKLYATLSRELGRSLPRKVFDPLAFFVNGPGWRGRIRWGEHPRGGWQVGYNGAGFRNPYEISAELPRLRVIVCGDSHIEGVVPYEDTVAALLERGIRHVLGLDSVEILNGASGGYDFYNYVGFLERSLHLRPDVYVVIVYGGNDFVGSLGVHAYFERILLDLPDRAYLQRIRAFSADRTGLMAQGFQQVLHFKARPHNAELALDAAVRAVLDMDALARREGIALMCVYLPPQHDVRPQDMAADLEDLVEVFGLDAEDLRITDRLADRLLTELEAQDVRVLDLRPAMRAEDQRLFWRGDHHLNDQGQRVVARELFPLLLEHLPDRH